MKRNTARFGQRRDRGEFFLRKDSSIQSVLDANELARSMVRVFAVWVPPVLFNQFGSGKVPRSGSNVPRENLINTHESHSPSGTGIGVTAAPP